MALHQEQDIAMGLFILYHIYKGMYDLVNLEDDKHSKTANGLV